MNQPPTRPGPMRFAGAGVELAGTILLSMFLGNQLDRAIAWDQAWCMVIGALIGLMFSMVRFYLLLRPNR